MSELVKTLTNEFANKAYAHAYMDEFYDMALSAQIKALREQRGWTQEELAQQAGMKQERVSTLESGDYSAWTMSTLRKLAKAFDITVKASFEPFSKGILDVINLKRDKLLKLPREEDLSQFCKSQLCADSNGEWKTVDNLSTEATRITFLSINLSNHNDWQTAAHTISSRHKNQLPQLVAVSLK
jgi:transcriptional regulator with XRE-family HTH domain